MNVLLSRLAPRLLTVGVIALLFGFGSAGEAQAGDVVLLRLDVITQQECNGDELSLEVLQDRWGKTKSLGKRNLGRGTTHVPLNINVPFCREAWVTLKEQDKRFLKTKTQLLGTIYIDLRPGSWWQDFTLNGAHYRLHYQVYP